MRESFLKMLNGDVPNKIVWTADIFYWIAGRKMAGQADTQWESELGYLKLCRELGIMPYYWYEKFWLGVPRYRNVDFTEDCSIPAKRISRWETPVGKLFSETVFVSESCSEACVKYPVENEEDLKTLLYLLEHRHLVPDCIDDYQNRLNLWAEYDGIPSIAMPRSPLSGFFYEWAGLQNGIYMLMDFTEIVKEILRLMEQQESPIMDAVCKLSPPVVHFADNLSSENFVSLFDSFMLEPYKRRLNRLHAAGVKCAVHLDGTVKGLLPKLANVGFDAIEALTPKPAGDITVEEMRTLTKNKDVILWGGMPGAMFAEPFTWNEIEKHIEDLIEAWNGTRFVIGVADQVPANGNIEFVKKISEFLKVAGK
jgi:hypothetical protein